MARSKFADCRCVRFGSFAADRHIKNARGTIHLWAFDLLAFNCRDLRLQPLVKRQARPQVLPERFGCPAVSLSDHFEDGLALLRVAEERGLEGVVSKRRDAPLGPGECQNWRKVKTAVWRGQSRAMANIRTRRSSQSLIASLNGYVSTV